MADMLKLQTPVTVPPLPFGISYRDKIMVLGSCFAEETGRRLAETGFDACVNPFGPLYNPVSLCNAAARLASGIPFTADDCVEIGAGDGRICSFSHHTSFARETPEAFLEGANAALETASAFWKESNKVLVTLGTSWCFRYDATGETVANCLKRPAAEFTRYALPSERTALLLKGLMERNPDKRFLFTVSPIRHLADGAHANQLSKASLLLAVEAVHGAYFPAYENGTFSGPVARPPARPVTFRSDADHSAVKSTVPVYEIRSRFLDWTSSEADPLSNTVSE